MTLVEGFGSLDVFRMEKEGFFFRKEMRSHLFAEPVSDIVSEYGGDDDEKEKERELENPLESKESGGEEQAVSRQEESEKESRLRKDDEKKSDIAGRLKKCCRIELNGREDIHERGLL
ncbi:MAG: hypothetical protein UY94_C0027G0005 [Parcubacteria group bacterium GW2011_GWA2_56_21]|nr:MAG: hypothetical protein UY94_C0027G0005 [Parcubacteria group bacterium GW2011_GWA2_56_21]